MYDKVVADLEERQAQILAASQKIVDEADEAQRELTQDEKTRVDDNNNEFDRLAAQIETRKRVAAQAARLSAPQPRKTDASAVDPVGENEPAVQTTHLHNAATRAIARGGSWGFKSLGDYAQRVRLAARGEIDPRLQAATLSTYSSEGTGADGGFAVPPEFRTQVMSLVMGEESLWSRCDSSPTSSNSVTVPADETTPWGTSGVRVYSRAEAAAMTQSKLSLKEVNVKLNQIYAFVPVTDELLDDAPMLANHLTTKAGEAINFKVSDYIVNGTGVGQPLGILNAACTVSQAAVGSQTADTIHSDNIVSMWGRMPGVVRNRAVWLCNQDIETLLMKLSMPAYQATSTTPVGGSAVFLPPGGLNGSPYSTLLGRPIIVSEACSKIGDVGDIILAYLPGYFLPYASAGIKSDMSMHLFFDQGLSCFRWTLRIGGQPWLASAISRRDSNNTLTLSHFVTLAAR